MKKTAAGIALMIFFGGVLPMSVLAATLNVELTATPSSGAVPLNGVDLQATVSGTATGQITYRFDCLNDGGWEKVETTANTTYAAIDLCNYSSPGSYLAKISVERQGLVFDGTVAILAQSNPNLSVTLSASPSFGQAPLNLVDLTAQVAGSASGDITYKFDCTSDNVWDRITTFASATYTAFDLCDYSSPGTYTARVLAERGGLSFQGTTGIIVGSVSGNQDLSVTKMARNLSDNAAFGETVIADPGEVIEFRISVTAVNNWTANNLIVKDSLPSKMSYYGNLKVDNVSASGDILQGLAIGNLAPSQIKTITFQAVVAGADKFGFGETDLLNTVLVYGTQVARTTTAKVKVIKTKVLGATSVPTGLLDSAKMAFLLSLMTTLLLTYFLLLRFYLGNRARAWGVSDSLKTAKTKLEGWLPKESKQEAGQRLAKIIEEIRKRETPG